MLFLILMVLAAVVLVIIPQQLLVIPVLLLCLFPRSLPLFYNSSNLLIILLAGVLFFRARVEKRSIISMRLIVGNPFFLPSILIWLSYLTSWIIVAASDAPGMRDHTVFLAGITCALILANLIIGYVRDNKSFRTLQWFYLILLGLNLTFGLLYFFKPGLVLIPGLIQDQTVTAGQGEDIAIRLGGMTFFWEAYGEYLMMTTIILLGLFAGRVYQHRRMTRLLILALLLLTIVELLLNNSRTPIMLAIGGALLVLFVFSEIPLHKKLILAPAIGLVIAIGLLITAQTGHLALFARMDSFQNVVTTEYGTMPESRAAVWIPAINFVLKHGYVGGGPSIVPHITWASYGGPLPTWPHNLVLLILSTVGLFGFSTYTFLLIRFLLLKKRINTVEPPELRIFYMLIWLAFVIFFIDTMKYDGFLRSTNGYFYHIWLALGACFSSANFVGRQGERLA